MPYTSNLHQRFFLFFSDQKKGTFKYFRIEKETFTFRYKIFFFFFFFFSLKRRFESLEMKTQKAVSAEEKEKK